MSNVTPTVEFLRDAQTAIGVVEDRLRELTAERDRLKAELATLRESEEAAQHAAKRAVDELAKLQAEREPVDNGDGTVTAMLPVTHPAGLDVVEARSRRTGDAYMGVCGGASVSEISDNRAYNIFLILRPAPKPPESVTWEARIKDGECLANDAGVATRGLFVGWKMADALGVPKPPRLGRYRFINGVGTLIQEAGHE